MKKILAWLLLCALLTGLWGCAAAPAQAAAQTASSETAAASPETGTAVQTEPAPETEPKSAAPLFLRASSVTFSVVGESEDIYMGLAPREQVRWESEDPAIVSVENGVLTARGVGTTTIRAVCADQTAECLAGCLAQTEEELALLSPDILSAPRRLLPEVDVEEACTFYDHSALVGDSISYMLVQVENKKDYLGKLLFLARGGTSLSGFVNRFKNIYFQGSEANLEDAIAQSNVDRMYILIGSNDFACDANLESYLTNWDVLVERLRQKCPDLEIVYISNIPQSYYSNKNSQERITVYNELVSEYNEKIKAYCQENNCLYLDLHYYMADHRDSLPREYNLDGYHLNDLGYMTWIKIMRYYAEYELEGGKLS